MKPDGHTYIIEQIASLQAKWGFRELLLLADPSETMVERYLGGGDMLVWRDTAGEVIGEAVVDGSGEVKNLAVAPHRQGRGWGRCILDNLCAHYKGVFPALTVGTSDGGVAFYERCGFRYSHTLCGFFTDNYPVPVIDESGTLCTDMIVLMRRL